jgi:hypothetical protein
MDKREAGHPSGGAPGPAGAGDAAPERGPRPPDGGAWEGGARPAPRPHRRKRDD